MIQTQAVIKTDSHGKIKFYGEFFVNPEYNILDLKCKHGLHLEYYNSKLTHYQTFVKGIQHGITYQFSAKTEALESISSHTNGYKTHYYSIYPTSNIRSFDDYTNPNGCSTSSFSHHGALTEWKYIDDDENNIKVTYHSNGIPSSYCVDNRYANGKRHEYIILWDKKSNFVSIIPDSTWKGSNGRVDTGLSATIIDDVLVVSFYVDGKNITNDVVQMCVDPLAITADENALIQLAHPESNSAVPELFQYELAQVAKKYPVNYGI